MRQTACLCLAAAHAGTGHAPVRCPLLSCPPKSCSRSVGMTHSSLGTGPSTRLLVMCMLVVMPFLVPSPLSPQPAAAPRKGLGVGCQSASRRCAPLHGARCVRDLQVPVCLPLLLPRQCIWYQFPSDSWPQGSHAPAGTELAGGVGHVQVCRAACQLALRTFMLSRNATSLLSACMHEQPRL